MERDRVQRLNHGGWDLWVAVCGVMRSSEDVWLDVFFKGFLNSLARVAQNSAIVADQPARCSASIA